MTLRHFQSLIDRVRAEESCHGALRKRAPFLSIRMRAKDSAGVVRRTNRTGKLTGNRRERITQLLQKIEAQLDVQKLRITLADFIRLTQLERELEDEEQPREIIVTWKDSPEGDAG